MLLSIIVPVYNEAGNIQVVSEEIIKYAKEYDFELIFVNDGSTDSTIDQLKALAAQNPKIKYVDLSRNFGHQHALKAGMDLCNGDCAISLDGDLQHPPSLMPDMIKRWQEGFDIVYTKRLEDKGLSYFKRKSSSLFYTLLNKLSEIKLEEGAADFRLIDRKVIDVFKSIHDQNLFIRGLISWVGFNSFCLEYVPQKRHSGTSKYNVKKMLILAINGITSFSVKPLRFSIYVGLVSSGLAFIYGIYAFYKALFTTDVVSGWTSLIISVLFIGGIQLFVLGIIGEYLGKLFMQSKSRPFYIVQESNLSYD